MPFFAFPESVRRIIYTTNQIEALNSELRRAVQTGGHFPNDDAAEEWKRPPRSISLYPYIGRTAKRQNQRIGPTSISAA